MESCLDKINGIRNSLSPETRKIWIFSDFSTSLGYLSWKNLYFLDLSRSLGNLNHREQQKNSRNYRARKHKSKISRNFIFPVKYFGFGTIYYVYRGM